MIKKRSVIRTYPGADMVLCQAAVQRVFRTGNGWGLIPSNQSRLFVFASFSAAIFAASEIRSGQGIPPWGLRGVHLTSEMNDEMRRRYGL